MPTQKIKDVLCSSAKDKVPDLDKAEVIYKVDMKCDIDRDPTDENYVGETKKATKHRMVEHHVMHRGEANESTAWTKIANQNEEDQGLRRSVRIRDKPQLNYREMDQGPPIWLTEGTSAVSTHLAEDHDHREVKVSVLGRERNKLRRGIREAIEIKKNKPTLNKNEQDRYYLPPIYDKIIEKTTKKNYYENRPRGREANDARPLLDQSFPVDAHR